MGKLQALYEALKEPPPQLDLWKRLIGAKAPLVRGLYLWGGPGRGKTWLMDAFFDSVPFPGKRRVHFHRFMLEIHQTLDKLPKTPNPLLIVADRLAARSRLLCVDEFHVTDVADAMLLAGLLEALFERQLTLVATSNTEPRMLYHEGLQRARFMPAIGLIEQHTEVVALDGGEDYRMSLLQKSGTCLVSPDDETGRIWLREHLDALVGTSPTDGAVLNLAGREVRTVSVADDVVWFTFAELCLQPRSARDYLELACEFHTLLLEAVPGLSAEMDEGARRFMHLIDALYDHGVKLVMTTELSPEQLYTGRQLARPFLRTASRLTEMASEDYLSRAHEPARSAVTDRSHG
ncbi:ATPase, AFG1 family [hydrothermal vent metagenome]|uniref:ATPase, AFG1 family n=1 Tax=hydrothermal vent metagenome TaxID=652676 RepID=A0A3B0YZH2_9ZZZZ